MDVEMFDYATNHPIEFNIGVTGALPTSDATLTIYAHDVDEEGGGGHSPEWNEVFFNSNYVGRLTGKDAEWSTSVFPLNVGWVQSGDNLVEIYVDEHPDEGGYWSTMVDWGQLLIDGGATKSDIASMRIDGCYEISTTVPVDVDFVIDVAEAGDFRLETNLLDPDDITVDADVYDFSASPGTVDYTVGFALNDTSISGTYKVNASLFYSDTLWVQQDVEVITFEYAEVCAEPVGGYTEPLALLWPWIALVTAVGVGSVVIATTLRRRTINR